LSYALFSFLPLLSLLNQLHFHNYWFKRRNKRKCNIACVMFIYLFYMACKNIKLYISILFYKGTKIAKITHFHLKSIYIYTQCVYQKSYTCVTWVDMLDSKDGQPKKKIIVETHETHFEEEAITLLVVVPMGRCLLSHSCSIKLQRCNISFWTRSAIPTPIGSHPSQCLF
jgi:hypothetical protein